jgi:hypothetical protein
VKSKLADHRDGRTPLFEDEHRIRHKDGVYRWVLSRGFAVRDAAGLAYRMAGAETDVTDRRAYDPLTGLPNRALLVERVGYAAARARRRSEHRYAVLFIDLDGFKAVNDTLGHLAGDQVLIAVARRLEACVRPGTWWPAWVGTSTRCCWSGSTSRAAPRRGGADPGGAARALAGGRGATWPWRPASGSR